MTRFLVALLLVLVGFYAINAQEPAGENYDALIKEAAIAGANTAMAGYGYEMRFVRERKKFFGVAKLTRRYKTILPDKIPNDAIYTHPMLLIYDSGKDLSSADISKERNRIVKELDKLEKQSRKNAGTENAYSPSDGYVTFGADENTVGGQGLKIDILELVNMSKFSNPREIEKEGRKTIVFDFAAKEGIKPEKELFYLELIEGTLAIDLADKRVVQIEGFAKSKDGDAASGERLRVLYFEQFRTPDGFWFPKTAELDFIKQADKFNSLPVKVAFLFEKYTKFSTGVDLVQIENKEETDAEAVPTPQS
ncbi:MAG: hypothetical protein R2684_02580 [Pyrinomonadaceae bacterium]